MKMKEFIPLFIFVFGAIFLIWALILTTLVALAIAVVESAAGFAAVGTFLAGIICMLAAHGMYLENEQKKDDVIAVD